MKTEWPSRAVEINAPGKLGHGLHGTVMGVRNDLLWVDVDGHEMLFPPEQLLFIKRVQIREPAFDVFLSRATWFLFGALVATIVHLVMP